MKLADWFKQEGLTLAGYCRQRGFNKETVRRHCLPSTDAEFRQPRREHILAYYVDSKGQVRPDDFYDLPDLSTLPEAA